MAHAFLYCGLTPLDLRFFSLSYSFSGKDADKLSHRADATIAAQATGAMSWAFINAMKKNPQQSYVQLLNSIRDELATKYTQKPQLSCSHPLSNHPSTTYVLMQLTSTRRHEPSLRPVKTCTYL